MAEDLSVLNRLFSQNTFEKIINARFSPDYYEFYREAVELCVRDPHDKKNAALIGEIYAFMSKSHRSEYVYQNTLINKLLLGVHKNKTATALTQLPIANSKADFVLITDKAVVYEIKTELDSFERLKTQLRDYFRGFTRVCLVVSEEKFEASCRRFAGSHVGIQVLTKNNTLSRSKKIEPTEDFSSLDHEVIFKYLRKAEYESIIMEHCGGLPVAAQVFYFNACLEMFKSIPLKKAYKMAITRLKRRSHIKQDELSKVPAELRSVFYFAKSSRINLNRLNRFLSATYEG